MSETYTPFGNVIALEFWKDFEKGADGSDKEVHFVKWGKRGDFFYHSSDEKVARLSKPRREENGIEEYDPIWVAIRPAYEAWIKGQEAPVNGTALESWAALTKKQVKIFRDAGYHAIEDVAAMTDADIVRVRMPDVRRLRNTARAYEENKKGSAHIETALAKRDEEIAALSAANADMAAQLGEVMATMKAMAAEKADA